MKKFVVMLLACALIVSTSIGCGETKPTGGKDKDKAAKKEAK